MSALGLITRNLAVGGASTGARLGRDPASDDGGTPNFDATLAESARDATQPGANPAATGAGQGAADGAVAPAAGATTPALPGDAQDRLRNLLDLSGGAQPASPRDGAAPAHGARPAGGVKAAKEGKGDDLVRRLLDLSAAAKPTPGGANSTATGAGIGPAAAPAARDENGPRENPAARPAPLAPRAAGAAPKGDDHAAKAPVANAPPPSIPDATLAAAMAQSANALGFTTTPASGVRPSAREDVAAARAGTGAAARAAAPPDAAARGGAPEATAIGIETPAAPTAVHIGELKTWLPPVAPEGAALSSAGRAPTPTGKAQNATTAASPGAALATKDAAPSTAPAPSAPLAAASAAGPAAPAPALPSAPKPKASTTGAAPPPATLAPAAPAPRRDLEITLTPKELGGLAVRMKSAGDRLEIAFVADKGDTARLIDDKSAGLASQLRGAGLGLGGLDISVAAKSADHLSGGLAANGGASFGAPQNGGSGQQGAAPPRSGAVRESREEFKDEAGEKASVRGGADGDGGLYL
jgi:hypothetical protein